MSKLHRIETVTMPLVERYSRYLSEFRPRSGDYLKVGDVDLGDFKDLVDWEYNRAKAEHAENPAFNMRPMWYTGSPYGQEILDIAKMVRG